MSNSLVTSITPLQTSRQTEIARLWQQMRTEDKKLDGSSLGLQRIIDAHPNEPLSGTADRIFHGIITAFDHYNATVKTCLSLRGQDDPNTLNRRCRDAHDKIALYVFDEGCAVERQHHLDPKETKQFMGKIIRAAIDGYHQATQLAMGVPDDAMDYPPYGRR